MTTSIRVERGSYGSNNRHYWYKATGSRGELIASGLAISEWFPQGRKRMADGGNLGLVDRKCPMSWRIKKRAGDCFELMIWEATDAQRELLDPMVPIDPEKLARDREESRLLWTSMVETVWVMATKKSDFHLARQRDKDRLLEALRIADMILRNAETVSVKHEQAALSVARRDQTFQRFMLNQGLRGATAEGRAS